MLSGGAAPCFDLYHALLHERPHEPDAVLLAAHREGASGTRVGVISLWTARDAGGVTDRRYHCSDFVKASRLTLHLRSNAHYLPPFTSSGRAVVGSASEWVQLVAGSNLAVPIERAFLTGKGGPAGASAGRRHRESGAFPADITDTDLWGAGAGRRGGGLSRPTPAPSGRGSAGPGRGLCSPLGRCGRACGGAVSASASVSCRS